MELCIVKSSDVRLELIFHSISNAYKAFLVDYSANAKFTASWYWKPGTQCYTKHNIQKCYRRWRYKVCFLCRALEKIHLNSYYWIE